MVPPVSVEAVQERLTCVLPEGVAVKLDGGVNVGVAVVADAELEYGLKSFKTSVALTR